MDTGQLAAALILPDGGVRPGYLRRAAVVALLSDGPDPDLVLTRRSARLRDHPGQMSLPGGMLETGEDTVMAALRESNEEIGLDPTTATILGALPGSVPTRGRVDVTAIVATWPGLQTLTAVDRAEVASVHRVPVRAMVDPESRFTAHLPIGYDGPGFIADGQFVWGITAHILDRMFHLAGWELPWERRRRRAVPRDVGGW